jgi:hypothetical protein
MLVRSGIVLTKYWFSITDEEQDFRFTMRIHDPLKQWKLFRGFSRRYDGCRLTSTRPPRLCGRKLTQASVSQP